MRRARRRESDLRNERAERSPPAPAGWDDGGGARAERGRIGRCSLRFPTSALKCGGHARASPGGSTDGSFFVFGAFFSASAKNRGEGRVLRWFKGFIEGLMAVLSVGARASRRPATSGSRTANYGLY
eukprot:331938-Prorocentrum_minimum.AAC.3